MKLTEKINNEIERQEELFGKKGREHYVKATSQNQDALEKQGLSSKDPKWFFTLYSDIMDGKGYKLKDKYMADSDRAFLNNIVDKHGLKLG